MKKMKNGEMRKTENGGERVVKAARSKSWQLLQAIRWQTKMVRICKLVEKDGKQSKNERAEGS